MHLSDITVPFLTVMANRDHIVPEASAAPLIDLVGSADKHELRLDGGHVGLLVGRTAAKTTIPTIIDFLLRRSEEPAAASDAGRYRSSGQERWSEHDQPRQHPDRVRQSAGDRPAIRLDDVVLTYAELDELSARAAGWLRARGVEPGDRVGVMLPNIVQFPVLYYAVLRAGAIVVPMNPLLKSGEIEHYLRDSGARLALVSAPAATEARLAAGVTGTEVVVADGDLLSAVRTLGLRAGSW